MSLIHTGVGPRLMVSRPTHHLTQNSLLGLSQRKQLLSAYRHLFRLRHFYGDTRAQYDSYCNLLRRKIRHSDIQKRRQIVLGLEEPMSAESLAMRLANTYAFIFNGTCAAHIPSPKVFFYEDMKQQAQERIEANVMKTLLQMDMQCPAEIKYDHRLAWVETTRDFYERVAKHDPSKGSMRRLHGSKSAHHLGYLQYEHTLMCANETCDMCL